MARKITPIILEGDRTLSGITIAGTPVIPGFPTFPIIPGIPGVPCSNIPCLTLSFFRHVTFFCLNDAMCQIINGPNHKCFNQ